LFAGPRDGLDREHASRPALPNGGDLELG
jgi:hypothetical protein